MAALIAATVLLITPAPDSPQNAFARPQSVQVQGMQAQVAQAEATPTRTVTLPQPVTSLTVLSYGGPVEVTGGSAGRVQVTETISMTGAARPRSPSRSPGVTCSWPTRRARSPGRPRRPAAVSFTADRARPASGVAVVTDGGAGAAHLRRAAGGVGQHRRRPGPLTVPGGPYALTADSGGGPESIGIATDPSARRSITVSSGGGQLQVGP